MDIDITKDGAENILALINAKIAPYTFQSIGLQLGAPRIHTLLGQRTVNTALDIVSEAPNPIQGTARVYYHRVALEKLSSGVSITLEGSDTLTSVLEGLAQHLNVVASECELGIYAIPQLDYGETLTFEFKAKPYSYLYTGKISVLAEGTSTEFIRQLENETLRLTESGQLRYLEGYS